jgi:hypothetical protein
MKNLLIAATLLISTAHADYIPGPGDDALCTLWAGTKDEQFFVAVAKIYMCYKTDDLDDADYYMDILEAIIHDEPLPD